MEQGKNLKEIEVEDSRNKNDSTTIPIKDKEKEVLFKENYPKKYKKPINGQEKNSVTTNDRDLIIFQKESKSFSDIDAVQKSHSLFDASELDKVKNQSKTSKNNRNNRKSSLIRNFLSANTKNSKFDNSKSREHSLSKPILKKNVYRSDNLNTTNKDCNSSISRASKEKKTTNLKSIIKQAREDFFYGSKNISMNKSSNTHNFNTYNDSTKEKLKPKIPRSKQVSKQYNSNSTSKSKEKDIEKEIYQNVSCIDNSNSNIKERNFSPESYIANVEKENEDDGNCVIIPKRLFIKKVFQIKKEFKKKLRDNSNMNSFSSSKNNNNNNNNPSRNVDLEESIKTYTKKQVSNYKNKSIKSKEREKNNKSNSNSNLDNQESKPGKINTNNEEGSNKNAENVTSLKSNIQKNKNIDNHNKNRNLLEDKKMKNPNMILHLNIENENNSTMQKIKLMNNEYNINCNNNTNNNSNNYINSLISSEINFIPKNSNINMIKNSKKTNSIDMDIYSDLDYKYNNDMDLTEIVREKNYFNFMKDNKCKINNEINNENENLKEEDFILFSPIEKDSKKTYMQENLSKNRNFKVNNRNLHENNFNYNVSNIATPCSLGVSSINAFQELRLKIYSRNEEHEKDNNDNNLRRKLNNEYVSISRPFLSHEKLDVTVTDKRATKIDDILNQLGTDREEYYNIKSLLENDKVEYRNKNSLNLPMGSVNTINELKHCVLNRKKGERSYLRQDETTDYSAFSKKNNFEFINKPLVHQNNHFSNFAKLDDKFKQLIFKEKINQDKKESKLSSVIKNTKKYVSRPYNNQYDSDNRDHEGMIKFYSKFINCNLNDNEVENLYSDYFSIIKEKVQSNPRRVLDRNFDSNFKKVQYENYNESNILNMQCIKLKKDKKSALECLRNNLSRESKNSILKLSSYNTTNNNNNNSNSSSSKIIKTLKDYKNLAFSLNLLK